MKESFMGNGCNSLPWTFFLFLLTCLDWYKCFFYMGHTSLRWNYTIYYNPPINYFAIMRTPNSIKTDNGLPVFLSKLKQFLHSFSMKHMTNIPYNPQTQDIVKQTHHTLKLQIKKLKRGEYTGTRLSSLSRALY